MTGPWTQNDTIFKKLLVRTFSTRRLFGYQLSFGAACDRIGVLKLFFMKNYIGTLRAVALITGSRGSWSPSLSDEIPWGGVGMQNTADSSKCSPELCRTPLTIGFHFMGSQRTTVDARSKNPRHQQFSYSQKGKSALATSLIARRRNHKCQWILGPPQLPRLQFYQPVVMRPNCNFKRNKFSNKRTLIWFICNPYSKPWCESQ